ncbi:MAG: T9SS type A sorting domain-containing protein [Bacteroidetes bacterium]|nr:T9SS type A sorting domain-containing protein [Bacteroidota bacterium]
MKKLLLLVGVLSGSFAFAQNANKFWKPANEQTITKSGEREIIPQRYLTYSLNNNELKNALWSAPHEKDVTLQNSQAVIYLPAPDGKLQAFAVVESPCMDAELSKSFSNIRTYNVRGLDDVHAYGKLDWNDYGFHGMVRTPNGSFFIDPYCRNNQTEYITYYTSDFIKDPAKRAEEIGVLGAEDQLNLVKKEANELNITAACIGTNLRTYRLAVACTGEYAVAATGVSSPTTSQILSKVVTSVNRVDGVYETEVAVKLVLVATTTVVLYGNATTDPFTGNNNGNTLIGESQSVITASVGTANFDIGHTFSTGGGGLAQLGCVCKSTSKASGITGSPSPVGDPYDIDYVAHEMGHQFGGNHSFNSTTGSCGGGNRNASTSMEPGSGITIMAYAGICGTDDLSAHSIAYFHPVNYDEIIAYTSTSSGSTCPVSNSTGNHAPTVSLSIVSINVPASTPFSLTGSGSDQDGDPLTYSWEEMDAGTTAGAWNNGSKPFFMSYAPTTSGTRYFPKLSNILTGSTTYTTSKGEFLSPTAQTLKFRFTARDNKMGGGGVCSATATVVVAASGPFSVTSQNTTGISYAGGSTQSITWSVASTTASPVSCANVNILISTDNGNTWTTVLANTPNDGTESVTIPTVPTTTNTCRVKVECANGAFFDINDKSFTITNVTGINEASAGNSFAVQLYPNPFNSEVQIEAFNLNESGVTKLTMVDVLGNVVLRDDISSNGMLSKSYNLEHLANGVYIVQLTNGNKKAIVRLIKQ